MKLSEKEFSEEVVEKVIAFLEKYGYADDREYCQKYIREKLRMKPKSGYALKIELRQRGISARIIDEVMAEMEMDEEGDAFRWLERKSRGNWPPAACYGSFTIKCAYWLFLLLSVRFSVILQMYLFIFVISVTDIKRLVTGNLKYGLEVCFFG